jgi:hypothetical protein
MTEAEWETQKWESATSAGALINRFKGIVGLPRRVLDRKCRLAAVAMLREFLGDEERPRLLPTLAALEQLCDDQCSLDGVRVAASSTEIPAYSNTPFHPFHWHLVLRGLAETDAITCLRGIVCWTLPERDRIALPIPAEPPAPFVVVQCRIILDVFGNPFRPVAFSSAWRTDTAIALARTMYDSREFSAMPILADALQDAGCDNTDILDHCRDANQVHVRGCWVVDLVLGKT